MTPSNVIGLWIRLQSTSGSSCLAIALGRRLMLGILHEMQDLSFDPNAPKLSKLTMKYRYTAAVGVIACNLDGTQCSQLI